DQTAQDTFSYTVSDGNGGSASAKVTVTVTGAVPGDGLNVSYFSDAKFTNLVKQTTDADGVINEDWGYGSPAGLTTTDNFTVRWQAQLLAPADGGYTFYAKVDDNVRFWIDDPSDSVAPTLLIRRWVTGNTSEWKSALFQMQQGHRYNIQFDYRELTGG